MLLNYELHVHDEEPGSLKSNSYGSGSEMKPGEIVYPLDIRAAFDCPVSESQIPMIRQGVGGLGGNVESSPLGSA